MVGVSAKVRMCRYKAPDWCAVREGSSDVVDAVRESENAVGS
jgi:hypothetical protein